MLTSIVQCFVKQKTIQKGVTAVRGVEKFIHGATPWKGILILNVEKNDNFSASIVWTNLRENII